MNNLFHNQDCGTPLSQVVHRLQHSVLSVAEERETSRGVVGKGCEWCCEEQGRDGEGVGE